MPREPHTTTVIVPGLRGHVEDHWQTRLAAKLPERRRRALVRPRQARPGRAGRRPPPGHPGRRRAGDHRRPQRRGPDHGALGPPARPAGPWGAAGHTPGPGQPLAGRSTPSLPSCEESGWLPIPVAPLRFPSIVAASTNDALGDFERVRALAGLGQPLHRHRTGRPPQPRLGYGDWPGAEALLDVLSGMRRPPGPAASPGHGPSVPLRRDQQRRRRCCARRASTASTSR